MPGHRKFRDLAAKIEADPVRVARSEGYTRAMEDALALGALRERRGGTQTAIAESIGTSQANVWRIEHEKDVYLSTLSRYVEALGGHLEILAVFPDETIPLMSREPAERRD